MLVGAHQADDADAAVDAAAQGKQFKHIQGLFAVLDAFDVELLALLILGHPFEIEAVHGSLTVDRSPHTAQGVLLILGGRPPERHHTVAHVLVNRAT